MTIENALSGLTYSIFCMLTTLFFLGLSMVAGSAMVYVYIKILTLFIKKTKGGIDELKKESKSLEMFKYDNSL